MNTKINSILGNFDNKFTVTHSCVLFKVYLAELEVKIRENAPLKIFGLAFLRRKTSLITCIRLRHCVLNLQYKIRTQMLILTTRAPREIGAITTPLISIFMKEAAPCIIW